MVGIVSKKKKREREKAKIRIFVMWDKKEGESKSMFCNCFFPLFSISKNNFLFLRLKNLFDNSKWTENKNYYQNLICEGNWKYAKICFQLLFFKSQWHTFELMNLSYLMN